MNLRTLRTVLLCGGAAVSFWSNGCGSTNDSGLTHPTSNPDASVGSTGGSTASTTCTRNADCASHTDGKTICDVLLGACVECASGDDCALAKDCIRCACTPIVSCVDSRVCGTNEVCDQTLGRCVECQGDADCTTHDPLLLVMQHG